MISGIVSDSQTQEPIGKAHVTLIANGSLTAITNSSEIFMFRALPAGGYSLRTEREDFYPVPLSQLEVSVRDGERRHGLELKLDPGGAFTRRVLTEESEPVAGCVVAALHAQQQLVRTMVAVVSRGYSDEEGKYRLRGVPNGRYEVRAQCTESFPAPHGWMRSDDPLLPLEGYAPVSDFPVNVTNHAITDQKTGQVTFATVKPGRYRLLLVPVERPWSLIGISNLLRSLAARGIDIWE